MLRDKNGWIAEYANRRAYWTHGGIATMPHALLTSGKHSSGFFNSELVTADEVLLREASADLLEHLKGRGPLKQLGFTCVVGPQKGATALAKKIAARTVFETSSRCHWASPAKQGEEPNRRMVFDNPARTVFPNDTVLLVEDVLTTGGSVERTLAAVLEISRDILPFVLVLVNRSGLTHIGDREIISLIDEHMPIYEAGECPLCRGGSQAIRPKGENWSLLTGTN